MLYGQAELAFEETSPDAEISFLSWSGMSLVWDPFGLGFLWFGIPCTLLKPPIAPTKALGRPVPRICHKNGRAP